MRSGPAALAANGPVCSGGRRNFPSPALGFGCSAPRSFLGLVGRCGLLLETRLFPIFGVPAARSGTQPSSGEVPVTAGDTNHPRCPRAPATAGETEARAGDGPKSPHGTCENTKNWENTRKRGNVRLPLKKNEGFNAPRGPSKAQADQEKPLWSWERGDGIIVESRTPTPHPQPQQRLQGGVPTELLEAAFALPKPYPCAALSCFSS